MSPIALPGSEARATNRAREEHEAHLRELTAEAVAAGDAFAAKLRELVNGYLEAERDLPGPAAFPPGPGPRACGYELPATLVNHLLGGPDWVGLFTQWKDECRRRRWL